jgi:homoserine kinase type II|tara:strand:- start:3752 stop:4708 length:957 start_codon:yes stop_codon:yes gene_type:complete
MSVYTEVSTDQLNEFLTHYSVGELVDYRGIEAGVENTNYFVTTTKGQFVLTLFENIGFEELPFCLGLTAFLSEHGLATAHPVMRDDHHYYGELCGKACTFVERLQGKAVKHPSVEQCAQIGHFVGRMHQLSPHFSEDRIDNRWTEWRNQTATELHPLLPEQQQALLSNEIEYQQQFDLDGLPKGVIHADLFHDNALFDGQKLTGVIDFYNACRGPMLYDLAIVVNDWCIHTDGTLDACKLEALLNAYQQERKLTEAEIAHWSIMLRVAAMRFWLSRLVSIHEPQDEDVLVNHKDPDEFKHILQDRQSLNELPVALKSA